MTRSRRGVLKLGGAAVAATVTGGLAGCSSISNSLSGGNGGGSSPLTVVPAGVSAVARGNVTRTLNDSAVTKFVNGYLDVLTAQEQAYNGPKTKAGLLDRFSKVTGIELSGAKTAVGYLKYPGPGTPSGQQYSSLWFEADWSESEVIHALESSTYSFAKDTYAGQPIYRPDREFQRIWVGVTGSNGYVLGTEPAVKETIDVATGDADSLGGDLKRVYERTRAAPFRFAAGVPENRIPSSAPQVGGTSIDVQQFAAVNHVAGATYHDGDTVGIVVRLLTSGKSEAEDVRNIIAGGMSAVEGRVPAGTLRKALDDVTVEQNGSTVVVKAAGSVDRATKVIKEIGRLTLA